MMPKILMLLTEVARCLAPLLRPLLIGCTSSPLQPIVQLMALEQSWADDGYAAFAEDSPRTPAVLPRSPAIPQEVRCSCHLH
ncbi:hypothetical protein [Streptomyces sp. NPDC048638]|uniref:hypothetical protein n=1 Tax=Streptomyces sp. NPDC048638 TaxID=3365580 RepID=UPI0037227F32